MKKIFKYLLILPLFLLIGILTLNNLSKLDVFAEETTDTEGVLVLNYVFPQATEIKEKFNIEYETFSKIIYVSSDGKYYINNDSIESNIPGLSWVGWYYDEEFTNEVNDQDTFTTDGSTLYGKFNIDTESVISTDFRLFKNKSANLFINEITNLYKLVLEYEFDSVKVSEDNYTGNGSTIGECTVKYEIIINSVSYFETITINVLNGLNCNYIFNKTIFIDGGIEYTKADLVSDLKLIGDLVDSSSLNINVYSDYYDVEEKVLEYDDLNVVYQSSDGTQGSLMYNLKLVNSASYDVTTDDDNSNMFSSILIIVFIVLVIVVVYNLFTGKDYSKYRYRRRR